MKHPNPQCLVAQDFLKAGKRVRLEVFGCSMHPTIRSGEWVRIEPLGRKPPKIGEILFFQAEGGKFLMHRVIYLTEEFITAHGDGIGGRVDFLEPSRVLGRVTHVEKNGEVLPLGLKGPGGMQRAFTRVRFFLVCLKAKFKELGCRLSPSKI